MATAVFHIVFLSQKFLQISFHKCDVRLQQILIYFLTLLYRHVKFIFTPSQTINAQIKIICS